MRDFPAFRFALWFFVFVILLQCIIGSNAISKRHLVLADGTPICTEKACDDDDGIQVDTLAGK